MTRAPEPEHGPLTGFHVVGLRGHPDSNDGEFYAIGATYTVAGNRYHESEIGLVWVKAANEAARKIAKDRARLFAAAPALLEALKELTRIAGEVPALKGRAADAVHKARAALSRVSP